MDNQYAMNAHQVDQHPVVRMETTNMTLTKSAASAWTTIKIPDDIALNDAFIIGAYVRKQNDGVVKKKNDQHSGLPLLATAAVQNCYLTISDSCGEKVDEIPLESLIHDGVLHGPLTYAEFILPSGIQTKNTAIRIDLFCLDAAQEVLKIHWIIGKSANCTCV